MPLITFLFNIRSNTYPFWKVQDRASQPLVRLSRNGGISMIRNIYAGVCGGMILIVAFTPVVILLIDRGVL